MTRNSPSPHRRVLIVEDETMFALNLEADMLAMGFDICDIAGSFKTLRGGRDENDEQSQRLRAAADPVVTGAV